MGSRLGQLAGGGYAVTRYAESAPDDADRWRRLVRGHHLGCVRSASVAPSRRSYWSLALHGTPTLYNWVGGESATKCEPRRRTRPAASVALTNGGGTGNAYINATNEASLAFDVVLPTTSLASDTSRSL